MADLEMLLEQIKQKDFELNKNKLYVKDLEKMLMSLENENNELTEKNTMLKEKIKDLNKEIKKEKTISLDLRKENAERIKFLEDQLVNEDNKNKNLIDIVKKDVDIYDEIKFLRELVSEKNQNINELKAANFELNILYDEKSKEVLMLNQTLYEQKVIKKELKKQLSVEESSADENSLLKTIIEEKNTEIIKLKELSLVPLKNDLALAKMEKINKKLNDMYRKSFVENSKLKIKLSEELLNCEKSVFLKPNLNIENKVDHYKEIIIDVSDVKKCFAFCLIDKEREFARGYGRCGPFSTVVFLELKALIYALEFVKFDEELKQENGLKIYSSNQKLLHITSSQCNNVYKNNDGLLNKVKIFFKKFKNVKIDFVDKPSSMISLQNLKVELKKAEEKNYSFFNFEYQ